MKTGALGIAFLSIAAGFACRPAFCWDKVGHMVVDQVAYGHLTPAAKTQVDSLIATLNTDPLVTGLDDRYRPYNPITEGALMDDIRGETKDFNTWHYVDLPDTELTPAQITAQFGDAANPNAYEIIVDKCEKTLADPARPAADRARMLAFLCHLVGDIHQPLHAIGRDLGGNRYKIDALPSIDPNSEWHINNLHAFWDNAYRYDDVNGKIAVVYDQSDLPRTMSPTMPVLTAYAHGLEARYPASDAAAKDLVPADWAAESQHLALTTAFPPATVSSLSPEYVHTAHDVACARLVLAGNRLANVLNQLFK
jgi:hypothetical protein